MKAVLVLAAATLLALPFVLGAYAQLFLEAAWLALACG
jgi:hypothetical protein